MTNEEKRIVAQFLIKEERRKEEQFKDLFSELRKLSKGKKLVLRNRG